MSLRKALDYVAGELAFRDDEDEWVILEEKGMRPTSSLEAQLLDTAERQLSCEPEEVAIYSHNEEVANG